MAALMNKTKNLTLCPNIEVATSMWDRTRGLLGRKSLSSEEGLWIKPCSSIHTYFMQFPIDVAFVDKNLRVTKIHTHVKPWRLVCSLLQSDSVFELSAGSLNSEKIEIGDELYVDR